MTHLPIGRRAIKCRSSPLSAIPGHRGVGQVVRAAVREGLVAGFEFVGKELAKQHKDLKKSLTDMAEVQVAIVRWLNPD